MTNQPHGLSSGWMAAFVLLLGVWALCAVVVYGWWQERETYPDRRMPGYDAWMEAHR